MNRRLLRAAAPLVLAAGAAVALSACDSAVPAQSREHSVISGVNTQVGDVLVRNASLLVDQGGRSGRLQVALVNEGSAADQLTSVSSPLATFSLPSSAVSSSAAASATATPTTPETPVVSTSAPATTDTTAAGSPVELLAGTAVFLDQAGTSIPFSQTTELLRIGNSIPVTFTFAAAGSVTISVPVTSSNVPVAGGLETADPAVTAAGAEQGEVATQSATPFAASTSVQPTTSAPSAP